MAGSYAASLLDELMGRNRDVNPNEKRHDIHWSDPQVCKYFICGICPHDLFTNTRSDLGACDKLHDESIRKEYQNSKRCGKVGYEEELMAYLTTVVAEADKRIQRGCERLQMQAQETAVPPTQEQADIDAKIESTKQLISKLVAEAEELGNEGNVDEAKAKSTECDQLRVECQKLQQIREKLARPFEDVYRRRPMEVCDICGAMLFVDDAPQRLDDHIMGKQHMGYARIRTYMADYKKKHATAVDPQRALRDSKSKEKDKPPTDLSNASTHVDRAADKKRDSRSKSADEDHKLHSRRSEDRHRTDQTVTDRDRKKDDRHSDNARRNDRDHRSHRSDDRSYKSSERDKGREHRRSSDRDRRRSRSRSRLRHDDGNHRRRSRDRSPRNHSHRSHSHHDRHR